MNRKIGIVGIQRTGLEVINYLLANHSDWDLYLFDDKPNYQDNLTCLQQQQRVNQIQCFGFKGQQELLANLNLIIASPGIPLYHASFALVDKSKIIGDIELFARLIQQDHTLPAVVGITGSNGKTTVTELTSYILKQVLGEEAAVKAGNVGVPIFAAYNKAVKAMVVELSSFQLETTTSLKLTSGAILNLSEDHLDRYASYQDYVLAKQRIFDLSEITIANLNDKLSLPVSTDNQNKPKADFVTRAVANAQEQASTAVYYLATNELSFPITEADGSISHYRCFADNFKLQGTHNYENILASFNLAKSVLQKLKLASVENQQKLIVAAQEFKGLDHRFTLVHQSLTNIKCINDSKATNVGAVISALNSLPQQVEGKVWLLLGGDAKKQDFTDLKLAISKKPEIQVICYGRDAELCALVSANALVYPDHSGKQTQLEEILTANKHLFKPSDTILLSPACASLDQFKNYEQRGEIFTEVCKRLFP